MENRFDSMEEKTILILHSFLEEFKRTGSQLLYCLAPSESPTTMVEGQINLNTLFYDRLIDHITISKLKSKLVVRLTELWFAICKLIEKGPKKGFLKYQTFVS